MGMQIGLGIHGLIGGAIVLWAHGRASVVLPTTIPEYGVVSAIGIWLAAAWLIVRARPLPPYRDQPEARFTSRPTLIILVAQMLFALWIYGAGMSDSPVTDLIFLVLLSAIPGGPIVVLLWVAARIRIHIGTWALAWGVTIVALAVTLLAGGAAPTWN